MLRRTVLGAAFACAVTVGGALAFAADLSGVRSELAERAAWLGRGFTPVPGSGRGDQRSHARDAAEPNASGQGQFCRFPARSDVAATRATPREQSVAASDSSGSPLLLEGASPVRDLLPPAQCTGDTVTAATEAIPSPDSRP